MSRGRTLMRNMFKLTIFFISFFFLSCDTSSECGKSKKDNCLVNTETFDKIQEGDSLNIVLDLLGEPFAWLDKENGIHRYSWFRYSIIDDPSKINIQKAIAIDFKENKVVNKEFDDYSLLDK